MIRKPAVAGYFYPGKKEELEKKLRSFLKESGAQAIPKNRVTGLLLPHAGYEYSGLVAAETVFSSEFKDILIILGPNHTGLGEALSVFTEGHWQMPMGDVEIQADLAKKIVECSRFLKSDTLAHQSEHSVEVILPFLQFVKKEVGIVPIILAQASLDVCQAIARDIIAALDALRLRDRVSIIASSDMTHYEPQESAQKKDHCAIEAIVNLDSRELLKRTEEFNISMCGVVPAIIMMEIAKELKANRGCLVKYQTSGNATGDYRSVVGYAGIKII
ncbi:MAG: AmmeMemoRadiSam system protein B [Candidatus Omnitrophota bacterium]